MICSQLGSMGKSHLLEPNQRLPTRTRLKNNGT